MMLGDVEIESISLYDLARKIADAVVSTLTTPGFKLKININQRRSREDTRRLARGYAAGAALQRAYLELHIARLCGAKTGRDHHHRAPGGVARRDRSGHAQIDISHRNRGARHRGRPP